MKVLNLYAGIGGNRKLWEDVEVTAVEWDEKIASIYQDFFPDDTVIVADAHQFLLDHFKEYDFIWSSPPCPTHSRARFWGLKNKDPVYPNMDLYQEIIFLNNHYDGKWCIENVIGYYKPLITPQELGRHYFWTNFNIREMRVAKTVHDGIEEMQERKMFDLSGYSGIDKRTILRNCVEPEIGYVVLESVKGNTQKTLVESIDSISKRSE